MSVSFPDTTQILIDGIDKIKAEKGELWAALVQGAATHRMFNATISPKAANISANIFGRTITAVLIDKYGEKAVPGKLKELLADAEKVSDAALDNLETEQERKPI